MKQEFLDAVLSQLPEHSDAIVWLQGDRFDRAPKVLELYQAGFAQVIFIVGNNVQVGAGSKPGEEDIHLAALQSWLAERGVPPSAIVQNDQALNAYEQAVQTVEHAKKNGWKRILLVASPYHQPRAFLTFLKAVKDAGITLEIVNQPAELSWDAIPSGRIKSAREYFADEEEKIKKYADHVATLDDGLAYLRRGR